MSELAVVPIFVNAGAAVLPAALAALTSMVALLFKPRELFRVCREKPHIPLGVLAVSILCFLLLNLFQPTAKNPAAKGPAASIRETPHTDWSAVALELIRQEQNQRALGGAAVLPATPAPAAAEDTAAASSPVFRGDYSRSGYLGGVSPTNLVPVWEYREEGAMFLSSPLVHGGIVYGASVSLDPSGNFGTIFALDSATGRPRWVADVRPGSEREFQGFFSSPSLSPDGRFLVIGQGLHADYNSELVCVEVATGTVKWLAPTPLHVESSPAVAEGMAIAGAGAVEVGSDHKPQGDPKGPGHPGFVFAVNLEDGKEVWRHQVNDPESSPAVSDGIAYIGSGLNGSEVVALRIAPDAAERVVWRAATPFPATGSVTLVDDLVLIGCGNGDFVFAAKNPQGVVLALDKKTGAVRWRAEMPDAVLGPIAAKDGKAICPVRNGEVVALNLKDGSLAWRQRISDKPVLAGTAYTGEYAYAVSSDGWLAVLNGADGTIAERHYLNAENKPGEMGLTLSSPLIADGRVYVGSETGGLRCFAGTKAQDR